MKLDRLRSRPWPALLALAGLLALPPCMAAPSERAKPSLAQQATPAPSQAAARKPTGKVRKAAKAPSMSPAARTMLGWVERSKDNAGGPFAIVDKRDARLWLFDAQARSLGSTPVLLGLARGDTSVPGIGERELRQIQPHERTTPAGRFVAEPGRNVRGEDVFWIDYDAAISMHRVRPSHPAERRLQRLATATPRDNRISYGCINVPARFYAHRIRPQFAGGRGVVYLLPETPTAAAGPPSPSAAVDARGTHLRT